MIAQRFEHFAEPGSCYKPFRKDYELPRISTLPRLTSKVPNIKDICDKSFPKPK